MADTETAAPGKAESEAKMPPAAAEREEGRHPLVALRGEMDRLFDDFSAGFPWMPLRRRRLEADPWRRLQRVFETTFPAVDIAEDEQGYRISAELPGMSEKDIDVALAGDRLTLKGEKREEREEKGENRYVAERRYGAFQRSFPLPEDADPDRIDARFQNGVLTITLPRRPGAEAKRRKIDVKAA